MVLFFVFLFFSPHQMSKEVRAFVIGGWKEGRCLNSFNELELLTSVQKQLNLTHTQPNSLSTLRSSPLRGTGDASLGHK